MKSKKTQRHRAVSLMENVLRDGADIAPDYPLVFGAAASGEIVSVEEDGDVRSACTTLVRDFLVDGIAVRGGLIGSVSTDPDFRQRGLATRVLIDAEERLTRSGCHFALLWADDADFYLARGWRPMGVEVDFAIPADLRLLLPRCESVRVAQEGDAAGIHALYVGHPQRIDRTTVETEQLLAAPGVDTLVAESGGQMVGYACMGRGEDLRHVVHEWGGPVEIILGLVRSHMERAMLRSDNGDVFLMTPAGSEELHGELERLGCEGLVGILGLGKILDIDSTTRLLRDVAVDTTFEPVVSADGPTGVRIAGSRAAVTVPRTELLSLLFPARGDRFHLERVERAAGADFSRLPLEPFAWGLDSI